MTTKEIKSKFSIYHELKRTDRFKRSLDILLAIHPEITVTVAAPFKCFKSETGKKFKMKIKNTKTGKGRLVATTKICTVQDANVFFSRGCTYVGYTLERLLTEKGIVESEIVDKHVYPHTSEEISSTDWGSIALQVSRLIESDVVHLEPCGKCNGAGIIPRFFHVAEGLCFECLGTKHKLVINQDELIKV